MFMIFYDLIMYLIIFKMKNSNFGIIQQFEKFNLEITDSENRK